MVVKSTRKNLYRRNRMNILTFGILVLLLFIGLYYDCIQIDTTINKSDHFNILTIDSILAGFLFTGLGILSSALDRPRIKRLDDGGYLDDYFNGIYISILAHLSSIIVSVFLIMDFFGQLKTYFIYIEIIGLFVGIVYFIKSVIRLFVVIKKMRKE